MICTPCYEPGHEPDECRDHGKEPDGCGCQHVIDDGSDPAQPATT